MFVTRDWRGVSWFILASSIFLGKFVFPAVSLFACLTDSLPEFRGSVAKNTVEENLGPEYAYFKRRDSSGSGGGRQP